MFDRDRAKAILPRSSMVALITTAAFLALLLVRSSPWKPATPSSERDTNQGDSAASIAPLRREGIGLQVGSPADATLRDEYARYLREAPVPSSIIPENIREIHLNQARLLGVTTTMPTRGLTVDLMGGTAEWTYDFGREIVGFPVLEFESEKGGTVAITYFETLYDERWGRTLASEAYSLLPGENRVEDPHRRAFRFARLRFIGHPGTTTLKRFYVDFRGHPVEYAGFFYSSDPVLNAIWQMGVHTVRLGMQEFYEDGIARDRALWVEDLRQEALINYYAFGDRELAKKSLRDLANSTNNEGAVFAVQGLDPNARWVFPDYVARWVSTLAEYYLHTGDLDLVAELYEVAKNQIAYLRGKQDTDGLLSIRADGSSPALDWMSSSREGNVTYHQVVYYKSLLDASVLADAVGKEREAVAYGSLAEAMKLAINEQLWWAEGGFYVDFRRDGAFSKRFAQDANVLAIRYGVANTDQAQAIIRNLRRTRTSIGTPLIDPPYKENDSPAIQARDAISPTMNGEEAAALLEYGYGPEATDLLRRVWGAMLNKGGSTTWEFIGRGGNPETPATSLSHGWSGIASFVLQRWVLGIGPAAPGWTKVQIAPRPADLSYVAGTVPTPQGPVTARYTIEGGIIREARVSVPPGVHATIQMPLGSPADLLIVDDTILSNEQASTDAVKSRTAASVKFELPYGGEHSIAVRAP